MSSSLIMSCVVFTLSPLGSVLSPPLVRLVDVSFAPLQLAAQSGELFIGWLSENDWGLQLSGALSVAVQEMLVS